MLNPTRGETGAEFRYLNFVRIVACSLATLVLASGCAQQLSFQAVDSSTGLAVPGVEVKRREVTSLSYFHHTLREHAVGSTDAKGMITVPAVTSKNVIQFNAPGYRGAAAGLTDKGRIKVSWALSPAMTPWSASRQLITNIESTITIPLEPLSHSK
jgi:hypothetical protein